jgi:hypothetical protein
MEVIEIRRAYDIHVASYTFEVLFVIEIFISLNISVFYDLPPYSLIGIYIFGGTCCPPTLG